MARHTRKGPPEPKPAGTPSGKPSPGGFNNPFAKLAELRDALPGKTPQLRAEDFPAEPPPDGPERAVVRLARRERDGAEVTRVEELGLPPDALAAWGQALQRGLACRVSVEGEALVLEGDQRRGVPGLLLRKGVRRVSQG
ncbi:translation initiation factor [Pyxidicoccus fallax]|uniref:Translation initiation factor n=1 Tax=Pyxidicoccus fallax TaxID=394095 RepID=A0A848L5S7_9BACT|nr:translation initiation factor [Pyxidicoccus fallax]NMO14300.1 translation initiation factor [Pyxidicoccus fallax]NPC79285.1 translation initiation factor [Pyxidicoccus fallax]